MHQRGAGLPLALQRGGDDVIGGLPVIGDLALQALDLGHPTLDMK